MSLWGDYKKAKTAPTTRAQRQRRRERAQQKTEAFWNDFLKTFFEPSGWKPPERQGGGFGFGRRTRNQSIPFGYDAGETQRQRKQRLAGAAR